MKKIVAIIVGGTGQFGLTVAKKLIKKNYKVIITTRFNNKKNIIIKKNLKVCKLNIYNKTEIKKIIKKNNPNIIFYFAGQSSPKLSFVQKRETFKSNVLGCKNFLEILYKYNKNCKFLNASSCEIFGNIKGKIKVSSPKRPVNPYGIAKLQSYKITKFFRIKNNLKTYNAIIFNTESYLRAKDYLIPKICIAAIKAKKYGTITEFGNFKISREWNWCEEQSEYLLKFINKEPQDFILSNGKNFSAKQMLTYAFKYFKIDYSKYILTNNKYLRKKDVQNKFSNYSSCLKRNGIKRKTIIFGEKLMKLMIKNYLDEKKY